MRTNVLFSPLIKIPAIGASVLIGEVEISNKLSEQTDRIKNPITFLDINSAVLRMIEIHLKNLVVLIDALPVCAVPPCFLVLGRLLKLGRSKTAEQQ
jgi:hypothetical protein